MAMFQPGQIQSLKSQGYSDDQIQQLQQQQLSSTDWSSLGLGMSGGQQIQPTVGATGTGGTPTPQQQLGGREAAAGGTTGALVRMILNQQGGGQQTGPPPPGNYYGTQYPLYAMDAQGNPTGRPVYANPTNQASLLGAAALQMPVVINPPPSGTPSAKSGVAPTGGALIGTSVPQVSGQPSWNQVASSAGLSQGDIAEFQAAGRTPADIAKQFNVPAQGSLAGPWTNPQIGSVFTPVARTAPTMGLGATPLAAAAQPTAIAYNPTATPFAQAPPAPGVQIPQTPLMMAHTSALANAGQALFAHFGGDPASASPADIANFHSQLTDHIAGLAAAPQPTAAKKMQRGGVVPGRGNEDSVPALLTPGEYVIPRPQVQQLMRTGKLPLRMADGGTVPDNDPNAPPEARRKTLTTAAQTQSTPPPAAPGGGYSGSSLVPGLATAAHAYGSSMANLPRNPIGSGSGVDIRNTALDPDPDLPSLKAAGMLGGGGMKSALGGIGSGLSQAAQAIASSVKPWQMQQNAIPAPPPAPPAPQFTQPPAPQQAQQGTNPYAAYAMNQARYPTSPYYT